MPAPAYVIPSGAGSWAKARFVGGRHRRQDFDHTVGANRQTLAEPALVSRRDRHTRVGAPSHQLHDRPITPFRLSDDPVPQCWIHPGANPPVQDSGRRHPEDTEVIVSLPSRHRA